MRLNVTSEIGRLKSVLVHLPGREIDLMVPPMMTSFSSTTSCTVRWRARNIGGSSS